MSMIALLRCSALIVATAGALLHGGAHAQSLSVAQERALGVGDSFKECADCPEMVVVPPGSFVMGSPLNEPGRGFIVGLPNEPQIDGEGPQRQVRFERRFAVGKFAVTFAEWDACVADGGCNRHRPYDVDWGRGKLPVINVSWNHAKAYVAWLSQKTGKPYRLLSEAEREYVTRAGTTTPYWWGSTISPQQANYKTAAFVRFSDQRTVPVDSFAPNPWGLYQVHGNVYDWVEDCWNDTYRDAPTDGAARISADCVRHVIRGGSFDDFPASLRSAGRGWVSPPSRGAILIGFRVARALEP